MYVFEVEMDKGVVKFSKGALIEGLFEGQGRQTWEVIWWQSQGVFCLSYFFLKRSFWLRIDGFSAGIINVVILSQMSAWVAPFGTKDKIFSYENWRFLGWVLKLDLTLKWKQDFLSSVAQTVYLWVVLAGVMFADLWACHL